MVVAGMVDSTGRVEVGLLAAIGSDEESAVFSWAKNVGPIRSDDLDVVEIGERRSVRAAVTSDGAVAGFARQCGARNVAGSVAQSGDGGSVHDDVGDTCRRDPEKRERGVRPTRSVDPIRRVALDRRDLVGCHGRRRDQCLEFVPQTNLGATLFEAGAPELMGDEAEHRVDTSACGSFMANDASGSLRRWVCSV
jgi:hypothetical protein